MLLVSASFRQILTVSFYTPLILVGKKDITQDNDYDNLSDVIHFNLQKIENLRFTIHIIRYVPQQCK